MLISSILFGFILTPLFVFCYYWKNSSFYKWFLIFCSILSISEPLLVSSIIAIKGGTSLKAIEIIHKLNDLTIKDLQQDHNWFLYISILLLSIPPLVVIFYKRKEYEAFVMLKPIINTLCLLATLYLFLLRIMDHVDQIGSFVLFHLALAVYPISLATFIGDYFVKLEKMKQRKKNNPSKEKKHTA